MITEEMLKSAARKAGKQNTEYFERDFSADEAHSFPEGFEKRIKPERRKADRPVLSAALRRVAVIVLAAFLSFGAFSTANAMPIDEFYGWAVRNIGNYYVLNYGGTSSPDREPVKYMLTLIPDGYTLWDYEELADTVYVSYVDEACKLLNFMYICNPDESALFIQAEGAEKRSATVNGIPATLLLSNDPDISSNIIWIDENNTLFELDGFFDEDELIKLAESVTEIK